MTAGLDQIPGATAVRGQSMSDMAYVDVVFGSESALAAGRAEIVRRMARAAAPAAGRRGRDRRAGRVRRPAGCCSTRSSRARRSTRRWARTRTRRTRATVRWVRKFQDLMLRPALEAVPGVAEVATLGGETERGRGRRPRRTSSAARTSRCRTSIAALEAKMATHPRTAGRDHPRPAAVQGDAGERRARRWPAARPTSTDRSRS